MSDKVAALTLQVQESPVHRMAVLDGLLDLGLKKERRTVRLQLYLVYMYFRFIQPAKGTMTLGLFFLPVLPLSLIHI